MGMCCGRWDSMFPISKGESAESNYDRVVHDSTEYEQVWKVSSIMRKFLNLDSSVAISGADTVHS